MARTMSSKSLDFFSADIQVSSGFVEVTSSEVHCTTARIFNSYPIKYHNLSFSGFNII